MKKKSRKRKRKPSAFKIIVGVGSIALAALIFTSLVTQTGLDDDRIMARVDARLSPFEVEWENKGGLVGAYFSFSIRFLLGWLAYFLPLALVLGSLRLIAQKAADKLRFHSILLFTICTALMMTVNIGLVSDGTSGYDSEIVGGYFSQMLTVAVVKLLGTTGAYFLLLGAIVVLLMVYTSIVPLLASIIRVPGAELVRAVYRFASSATTKFFGLFKPDESAGAPPEEADDEHLAEADEPPTITYEPSPEDQTALDFDTGRTLQQRPAKKTPDTPQVVGDYTFPSIDLLTHNTSVEPVVSNEELITTSKALRETLETFRISIDGVIEKYPGPVITRYEFKPGMGIKVNQIVNVSDDLALNLKAKQIRIIAPIPGKAAVGVEVPNRNPQLVYLRDLLNSDEYKDPRIRLPLAFGKLTNGKPFVADLARMPHLLVAGATGSGKSVCINVLISSMIYRFHPSEIKFIFIDPKMLELSMYSGIPHLARNVVTKAKTAERVLAETVVEMETRYAKLRNASVRNLEDYNRKQKTLEDKLPYIIIFVDELADLMMSSQSTKTELLITRLAQMARAVGIHLVLATQRPSVDVITGLIKANFPARIAFQVPSKIDSRTIIDANGAEKLLGSGDMLFLSTGVPEPVRIHGAFISSEETERIVEFIKSQRVADLPATEDMNIDETEETDEEDVDTADPLFREACEVVIRHKQGSVSLLQRRLGIGYQRAARLIDKLEHAGVVSPFNGSKVREVLVDRSYLESLLAAKSAKVTTDAS